MKMEKKFNPIRRQDRKLDEERMRELLDTSEYGYLSLGTSQNGYAYGLPINFVYDKASDTLYFHCAPEGHKLDNMQQNNRVSFCVVGKTKPISEKFTTLYESTIVFGQADIHLSDEEKKKALRLLVNKYSPNHSELGEVYMEKSFHRTYAFKITIEHISGKCKI